MSDEDRSMNFMERGIGDRPTFKAPSKKSKDVKPTQITDSNPASKENVRKEASI
jgi:hypothetical protein